MTKLVVNTFFILIRLYIQYMIHVSVVSFQIKFFMIITTGPLLIEYSYIIKLCHHRQSNVLVFDK